MDDHKLDEIRVTKIAFTFSSFISSFECREYQQQLRQDPVEMAGYFSRGRQWNTAVLQHPIPTHWIKLMESNKSAALYSTDQHF